MKINVFEIDWDIDEEDIEDGVSLETSMTLETDEEFEDDDELEEWISDEISNETGFCHRGFLYEKGEIV